MGGDTPPLGTPLTMEQAAARISNPNPDPNPHPNPHPKQAEAGGFASNYSFGMYSWAKLYPYP